MFVKIYRGKLNETVYECRSYHLHTNGGRTPSISLEFSDGMETISLDNLEGNSVYIMNSNGVTVDSYHFDGDLPKRDQVE